MQEMCTHVVQLVTQPIIPTYPTNYTNIPMTYAQVLIAYTYDIFSAATDAEYVRYCFLNEPDLCKKSKELKLLEMFVFQIKQKIM